MYWMYAIRDDGSTIEHKGDSGSMSVSIRRNEDSGELLYKQFVEPEVGYSIRVGSLFSRSFSNQDYWTTTPVTEIVSRTEEADGTVVVIFKTKNSTYKWLEYNG